MAANACSRKHDVRVPPDQERVEVDAALLAATRRRYAGRGDVEDQLWWLAHPGTRAPSGAEDPVPALEAARAGLYRPGASPTDSAALLRELAAVSADRDAARTALHDAEAEREAQAPGAPNAVRSHPVRMLLGVAIAALLIGGASGFAVGRFGRAPAPVALARFAVRQQAADVPPSTAMLPASVIPSTYRLLGTSSSTGTFAYAAKAADGRVCLVAVLLAQAAYTSCTSEAGFAVAGLALSLHADTDPTDDSGVGKPVEIDPHWGPDGAFGF